MDAAGAPIPPPYGGQGTAAFPIAIVMAIGFVVTSLILISYYFLVVRCWLRGGGPGSGLLLHRARRDDRHLVERVSAVFFTDHEAKLPGRLDPDAVAALHHNVSCLLYRTDATGDVHLARDDHDASCRDL